MSRILLVLDDEPAMGRLIKRALAASFDEIRLTTSPAAAESVLRFGNVTHIVCDQSLGCSEPNGTDLLGLWRKQWPGIKYAVLFTGSQIESKTYGGVDRIFVKPDGLDALVKKLREVQ